MSEFGDTASGPSHFVPQVFFFVPQGMPGPPGEKGEVGDVGSMVWTMGENGVVVVGRGWPLNQFGGGHRSHCHFKDHVGPSIKGGVCD